MNLEKKAALWAQILGRCPDVLAIFLSGSVAQGRATEASDIDFFIIARPGAIWTARFFVFVVLKLSRQLAKPAHHAGKICPNHFITVEALEITEKNTYSAHLFAHNRPLYDPWNIFPHFALANEWVQEFGQAFVLTPTLSPRERESTTPSAFWCWLEGHLERWQRQKIYQNPDFNRREGEIVLTDQELRFHPEPRYLEWKESDLR